MACYSMAMVSTNIKDKHLQALLAKNHPQLYAFLKTLLEEKGVSVEQYYSTIVLNNGKGSIWIGEGGEMSQQGTSVKSDLFREVEGYVNAFADQLLANEMVEKITLIGEVLGFDVQPVDDAGEEKLASIITFRVRQTKGRVFVLPGGKLQVMVDTGTFEVAKESLEALMQGLENSGMEVEGTSQVESHRNSRSHVHLKNATLN